MYVTTAQIAELTKHLAEHYAWAGSVRLRQPFGFDPETGLGVIDVDVVNDADVVDSFEVNTLGQASHYA